LFKLHNPLSAAFIPSLIPDQKQKAALFGFYLGWVTLLSCFWLLFPVPMEDVQVASKNVSELVYDIIDVPFFNPFSPQKTLQHVWVVIYAFITDAAARDITARFRNRYFTRKPVELGGLKTRRLKVELIKAWHDRGTACFWRAVIFTISAFGASIALTSLVPHRRAAVVVHCVLWALLSASLLFPAASTLVIGALLVLATRKHFADGFLSYFPAMIDFELIDVANPRFLAWRYMQIEKEAEVLASIYDPKRHLTFPTGRPDEIDTTEDEKRESKN
jgi:hypothetical protein